MSISRRRFLGSVAGAGLLGSVGGLKALSQLKPVSAAETVVTPEMVRFTPEIEPIVRLIEETPRDKCVEVMANALAKGMSYRQFLAGLFLAGIRNINPQPPGFKFHCVFVIHSCNYLSRMGTPEERYLPLFYALDDFKKSQGQDIEQGDFVLGPVKGTLPTGQAAWDEFHAAMRDWDEARADRAITALVREQEPEDVFEGLWEYGARDYRNIGHKIIFVSHAWRTLQAIGWEHAEPTLRSLILGLLDFGPDEVVNGYAFEDQGYIANAARAAGVHGNLPGDWAAMEGETAVVEDLLAPLREGKTEEACRLAVELLEAGKCKAGAIWDAAHLAGGEMMMRQPGIAGLHTLTSGNSMQYAFLSSKKTETRLLLLLQGLAWMCQFRNLLDSKRDKDVRITQLEAGAIAESPEAATEEILSAISTDRAEAAAKAYAYDQKFGHSNEVFDGARRLVFTKCTEHHQYKWPAAVFEDYGRVSPEWRPHMAATAMYYLRGTGHPDSPVIERALEELKTVPHAASSAAGL